MHISAILFRTFKANVFQRDIKDKNFFFKELFNREFQLFNSLV